MKVKLESRLKFFSGKSILVTGGSGFIGNHLITRLNDICKVTNLSRNEPHIKTDTIIADITDIKDLKKKLSSTHFDCIFHLAGNVITPVTDSPDLHFNVNARGTKNILEICRLLDIPRIIYASSMTVYGEPRYLPVDERHPLIPDTAYGLSKLIGEHFCNEYYRHYSIQTTNLRFSYVYGPGQPELRVIPLFIKKILSNQPMTVLNRGVATNDYVFVSDVIEACILAASERDSHGQSLNIGSGTETSVDIISRTVQDLMKKGKIVYEEDLTFTPSRFVYDISRAENCIGYKPEVTLKEGITKCITGIKA